MFFSNTNSGENYDTWKSLETLFLCYSNKLFAQFRYNMTPEVKARVNIDKMFADSGWKVVDRDQYEANLHATAIREGLLKGNKEADYFLFADEFGRTFKGD